MPIPTSQRPWLVPAILLLGLSLRGYHYFRCPEVWHDEAALLVNILDLSYAEQLGPLQLHQAAPPLYLWLQRTIYLTLGDQVQLFRLVSFLASCGTLLLLVPLCRRWLSPSALSWALLLFACGEKSAWHGCEVKPYALDAFVAVLVLYLVSRPLRTSLNRRLVGLALLAPVLLWLSYPALFVLGGVFLVFLPVVWRSRNRGTWLRLGLLGLLMAGAFLLLVLGPVRAQRDADLSSFWIPYFPDWSRPWAIPLWTITATCEVFRYAIPPLGQVLLIFAVVGGAALWRNGRREPVVLLMAPVLLALLASALHRYPYGGVRLMFYAAPALAVLTGAGVPIALSWVRQRSSAATVPLLVLLSLPGLQSLRGVVTPWDREAAGQASAFVLSQRQPADLVVGNNWTHCYYFHRLGSLFRSSAECNARSLSQGRAWIVYTSQEAEAKRRQGAQDHVPDGWSVQQQRDFRFTTVLLAIDPQQARLHHR